MAESNKGQDPTPKAQEVPASAESAPQQSPRQSKGSGSGTGAGGGQTDSQQSAQNRPSGRRDSGDTNPLSGLGEATQAAHAARVTVPGHDNVDARLDNRAGRFRPPLEEFPAKPQQIDGPDLAHQVEHTRATLDQLTEPEGERKGMFSPGPHGLSGEELREGPTTFGSEGLTVEEAGQGRPTA